MAAEAGLAMEDINWDYGDWGGEPRGGGDDTPPPADTSWVPVDLGPALDGTKEPVVPLIGQRDDGVHMFYPGKTHNIVSESEGGKTWLALATIASEIAAGYPSILIDFEDDEQIQVDRLRVLGVAPEDIRKHLIYLRPETPVNQFKLGALIDAGKFAGARSVWLDGVTEAMTLHGYDPLNNTEFAQFNARVAAPLAKAGFAQMSLDHVVKSPEGRGRYALGGVHKLNAVSGAQYVLENREPFGIGRKGISTIRIAKDRPGQLRRRGLPGKDNLVWFGDLVIDSHGEEFAEISITPPREAGEAKAFRPTELMSRVSQFVQDNPGLSQKAIVAAVRGKAQTLILALELLAAEGYVRIEKVGQSSRHYSVTPFKGSDD